MSAKKSTPKSPAHVLATKHKDSREHRSWDNLETEGRETRGARRGRRFEAATGGGKGRAMNRQRFRLPARLRGLNLGRLESRRTGKRRIQCGSVAQECSC